MTVLTTCFGSFAVLVSGTAPLSPSSSYPTLLDTRIPISALTIPAAISKSGTDTQISLPSRTVITYSIQQDIPTTTCVLNGASLLNSYLGYTTNQLLTKTQQVEILPPSQSPIDTNQERPPLSASFSLSSLIAISNRGAGIFIPRVDTYEPSIIGVTSGEDTFRYISNTLSIPRDQFNIPDEYLDAFMTYVLAHEIGHGHNELNIEGANLIEKLARGLQGEIDADHIALSTYFNDGFAKFIYDWRALGSFMANTNYHFTHIWGEEVSHGLPNDEEAQKIIRAHRRITSKMNGIVNGYVFMMNGEASTDDRITSIRQKRLNFYAATRYLNENNIFDEDAYAKEFVEKYIRAFETLTKESYHDSAEVKSLIEFYQKIDLKNMSAYLPTYHSTERPSDFTPR